MATQSIDHQAVDDAILALVSGGDAVRANPYPLYVTMRQNPVHQSVLEAWFVTSYAGCDRVLRHPAFKRGHGDSWERRAALQNAAGRHWWEHQQRWMLWLDPPDHGRIRSLVSRAFTPRYVDAMRPRVAALVDSLLDSMLGAGEVDFVDAFALPVPITVICDMLGVPDEARRDFRAWTLKSAGTLQPLPSEDAQDAADVATAALEAYFTELVEIRRRDPGDDLLSAMIAAEEGGERLSLEELIANAVLLLAAGFETTTNLLGNGMLALLRNPAEWRRLVDAPSLAANACEELLRYDSSVQFAGPRVVAAESVEIDGTLVPEGSLVLTLVGAGNRDPRRFDEPDRLDVARENPAPLSFGAGPHFCLGAALARMETTIALEALARRAPHIELLDAEPPWLSSQNIHGVESLRVRI
jgi:cytochrome P450